jgi:pimeloyl-ACP methyl ester carboxylesterase
MSFAEIEGRLEVGADQPGAAELFGERELAEMEAFALAPEGRGAREAVVLLPGVMGSLLTSVRGVTTLLWINPMLFLKGQASYLELSQDGSQDACSQIDAVPLGLERMVYTKIAVALRRQTDLYEFPFDWRRPMEWNADLLNECLERWAGGQPGRQFTLVGHSMGGIVSRAYMARHMADAERRIKRLIMHGTPHYGAAGTVENLINGNRMMDLAEKLNDQNQTRRFLLNMPSAYQLLPAPPSLFPSHRPYPANWDLYDARAWQLEGLRQDYLDLGRRFHEMLAGADPQIDTIEIAGCNGDTIVAVDYTSDDDGQRQLELVRKAEGPDAGDGTVPLWSAVLPSATIYYIQEVHRNLSKNKRVIEATLELIHGGVPDLPTVIPPPDDGWLFFAPEEPVEVEAERLRQHLEEGTATADELSQLYFAY